MTTETPPDLKIVTAQPEATPVAPVEAVPAVQEETKPEIKMDEGEVFLTTEEQERLFSGQPLEEPEAAPKEATQESILKDLFDTVPIDPSITSVSPVPIVEEQKALAEAAVVQDLPGMTPQPVPAVTPPVQQTPAEAALTAQLQVQAQQMENMQGQIANMMGQQAPQQQAQQQPQFNFQVPDEYMTALNSDDPSQQKAALNGLLTGVAEITYQRAQNEMTQQMQGIPATINAERAREEQSKAIHDDMYKTYPELNDWKQQVAATASQVASEMNTSQWSPQIRDEVARRLAPLAPAIAERVNQNIAQRATPQIPQALPQGTVQPQVPAAAAPIPQHYTSVQGMPAQQVQVAPTAQTPQYTLVRQPDGRIVSVPLAGTPQYAAAPGTRPAGSVGVSDEIQDVWATLGYS